MLVLSRENPTFALQIRTLMPKVKTNSSAKKRFSVTGSGRIKRNKAYKSHLLTKKSTKRKRNLRGTTLVDPTNEKRVKNLLGLG